MQINIIFIVRGSRAESQIFSEQGRNAMSILNEKKDEN